MIKLSWKRPDSVEDIYDRAQTAINLEFSTLPPYLYALLSIPPGENSEAVSRLHTIAMQEMVHMCLACNIMNAIGGTPAIAAPVYPGPLPGDLAHDLQIHLYPFSPAAVAQGKKIELPEKPVNPSVLLKSVRSASDWTAVTIGQYYHLLDAALKALPPTAWVADRNQLDDSQFFQGQLFKVNSYADAHAAIDNIVSEGEGTPVAPDGSGSPLDFQNELAHYYRFWEIEKNLVLTKSATSPSGYRWGPRSLGVDWSAVYDAIDDPEKHDFSRESPAARAAQQACNQAYTDMIAALNLAFSGTPGQLGVAVRAMFDLRMAARAAFTTPLRSGKVAGPAFLNLAPGAPVSNQPAQQGGAA